MDAFAALADPIRRQLLLRLRGGPARVIDLAGDHEVSRPAISRHLKVLSDAGLVEGTDAGRERIYSLRPEPLDEVARLVATLSGRRPPVGRHELDALDTEVHRTTRDMRRSRVAAPTITSSEEETA